MISSSFYPHLPNSANTLSPLSAVMLADHGRICILPSLTHLVQSPAIPVGQILPSRSFSPRIHPLPAWLRCGSSALACSIIWNIIRTLQLKLIESQIKHILKMLGINGLGRIGRLILRSTFEIPRGLNVAVVNDPFMDPKYLKYLLTYDSAHLRFPHHVELWEHGVLINGQKIRLYSETDPTKIPWGEHGVATVCESTGKFLTTETAALHLKSGAKKVIISAPPKDETPLFVFGVNHLNYKTEQNVVSNASCTTNCLAPVAKVIHDNFVITEGLMTTVHAATASQAVVDSAVKKGASYRGGRATGNNIVPYSTGAAKALGKVIPSLKGKVTGMSFRVPTINVSVVDFTFKTQKEATYDEISAAIRKAAEGELKGILGYTEDEIVSSDILHDPHSSVYDKVAGLSLNKNFHKVVSWYDNEWGYSNRMVDLAKYIHQVSGI